MHLSDAIAFVLYLYGYSLRTVLLDLSRPNWLRPVLIYNASRKISIQSTPIRMTQREHPTFRSAGQIRAGMALTDKHLDPYLHLDSPSLGPIHRSTVALINGEGTSGGITLLKTYSSNQRQEAFVAFVKICHIPPRNEM